jgi:hypothetical protein
MGLRCGVRYLRRGDEASAGAEGLNDLNGAVKYERALGHRAAKTPEGQEVDVCPATHLLAAEV